MYAACVVPATTWCVLISVKDYTFTHTYCDICVVWLCFKPISAHTVHKSLHPTPLYCELQWGNIKYLFSIPVAAMDILTMSTDYDMSLIHDKHILQINLTDCT